MMCHGILARTIRAAAVSAFLIPAAACAGSSTQSAGSAATRSPGAVPGQVTASGPGIDLHITDAVAHLDASRTGELSMTVRNSSPAPEHLAMVATAGGGRATLEGDSGVNGAMSTAGVLVQSDSTVTFGGKGPRVLFHDVQGVTADHTLPITLEFGVAGLVHLEARVSGG
jgi:copper(I)-binding protein